MNLPRIIMTRLDLVRIRRLLKASVTWPHLMDHSSLYLELNRALIVDPARIPDNVVTMNSRVLFSDEDTGIHQEITLVYPENADASLGRVSILSPIGSALIGLSSGQSIEWPDDPSPSRRIRILSVLHQPEAAGHYLL